MLEVHHSGTITGVLTRTAQRLYCACDRSPVADVDQAKHTVQADVDVPADRGLRMREEGTKLDTAIERTGCEGGRVEGRAKVVADPRHESEGLREEFEPEIYPADTRRQRGRLCEAQEYRPYATFGNHLHPNGPPWSASRHYAAWA